MANAVIFDVEAQGLNFYKKGGVKPFLLGFKQLRGKYFLAYRENKEDWDKAIRILTNPRIPKICHNIKYEMQCVHELGYRMRGKMFDTLLMAKVYHSDWYNYQLDVLAKQVCDRPSPKAKQLAKWIDDRMKRQTRYPEMYGVKHRDTITYDMIDRRLMSDYNKEDLDHTEALYNFFNPRVDTTALPYQLLIRLVQVIIRMEQRGVTINMNEINKGEKLLSEDIDRIEKEIKEIAAIEGFNPSSNPQVATYLIGQGIDLPKTTKGNYSVKKGVLEQFEGDHPFIKLKMEWNRLSKLRSTYFVGLKERLNGTNVLHCEVKTHSTRTYRLSSSNPNSQNFPKRADDDRYSVRRLFVPRKGYVFVCFDYSQIEYRLYASYSEDPGLIEPYKKDPKTDFHQMTADDCNIPRNPVAKNSNFCEVYGGGVETLARTAGITVKKAREVKEQKKKLYPLAHQYKFKTSYVAERNGYIDDIWGHKYYVYAGKSYTALNYRIQGTAAQIIKISMIEVDKFLHTQDFKSKMLLSIHDELLIETHKSEVWIIQIIKRIMENFTQFEVPILVDVEVGEKNWKDKVDWLEEDQN